jgi:hypothetical protein
MDIIPVISPEVVFASLSPGLPRVRSILSMVLKTVLAATTKGLINFTSIFSSSRLFYLPNSARVSPIRSFVFS